MIGIALENPLTDDLALLFSRHTADMHADTPPESIHMMDRGALNAPGIWFFVMREEGRPLAMGAFKRIDETHAEIKSMHVLAEARGRGLSRRMRVHLIQAPRVDGFSTLPLETQLQPPFLAARALYANAGFVECPPFEGYTDDPNSVFMTKPLA